jgi:hypothetical protein
MAGIHGVRHAAALEGVTPEDEPKIIAAWGRIAAATGLDAHMEFLLATSGEEEDPANLDWFHGFIVVAERFLRERRPQDEADLFHWVWAQLRWLRRRVGIADDPWRSRRREDLEEAYNKAIQAWRAGESIRLARVADVG